MSRRPSGMIYALLVGALLTAAACVPPLPEPAEERSVVLNELMYHPAGDVDGEEFVELHNRGTSPLDLGGWCFTEGIDGCFTAGTILEPDSFVIAARSSLGFEQRYGLPADTTYTGKLSNGGERLMLIDATGDSVFDCTYSDDAPWPTAPDGAGSSLERLPGDADCNDPAAWASSTHPSGSTPRAANSSVDPSLPSIVSVEVSSPIPGEAVPIVVRTDRANAVSVDTRIDFGESQTVALHDDGAHDDGEAGDGTWGGSLPATPAAGLLRYRVTAASTAGLTVTDPPASDGMQFRGMVAEDGSDSDLPRLRWYMDPNDFDVMTTEHLTDKQTFPAVIAFGDRVYDNARVAVKGTSSILHAKKKFAFDLPEGYLLDVPWLEHGIDEFDLQDDFTFEPIDEQPAWRTFDHFDVPTVQSQFVRVHKSEHTGSSEFYGTYLLREDYDGTWREREGFDDGTFFKHGQENKSDPDAGSALADDFITQITTRSGDDLRTYLIDHLDVPTYINFMAIVAVTQYDTWGWYFNVDQFVDERTGRWQYLPLDLDDTYDGAAGLEISFDRLIEPTYDPYLSDPEFHLGEPFAVRFLEAAVFQFPEFRDMYFRRLVSIQDELEAGDLHTGWYDAAYDEGATSFFDDHQRWLTDLTDVVQEQLDEAFPGGEPPPGTEYPPHFLDLSSLPDDRTAGAYARWHDPSIARELFHLNQRYFAEAVEGYQGDGLLPATQSPSAQVEIAAVAPFPEGDSAKGFIALWNPGPEVVDLSGWLMPELDFRLPNGSVLPTGACAVVVRDDPSYRAYSGGGHLVFGEFAGSLDEGGGSLTLTRRDGTVAGTATYAGTGAGMASTSCAAH